MKRIRTLVAKDFLETRRDRLALLFTVVMPLAFTAFFGLMFGGGSDRLPLAIHSADSGAPATQLVSALARSGVVKTEIMTQDDAEKAVDDNKVAAALVIPAGFSAALAAGRPAELTLVSIAGSTGAQTVQTEVMALAGELAAGETRGSGGCGGGRRAARQRPRGRRAGAQRTPRSSWRAHSRRRRSPTPSRQSRSSRPAPPPARSPTASS